jgi:hypothetical protein
VSINVREKPVTCIDDLSTGLTVCTSDEEKLEIIRQRNQQYEQAID